MAELADWRKREDAEAKIQIEECGGADGRQNETCEMQVEGQTRGPMIDSFRSRVIVYQRDLVVEKRSGAERSADTRASRQHT